MCGCNEDMAIEPAEYFKLRSGLGSTAALLNCVQEVEDGWTHQNVFCELLPTETDRPRDGLCLLRELFSMEPEPAQAITLNLLVALNAVTNFNHVYKAN